MSIFSIPATTTVIIYMKSGNKIVCDKVYSEGLTVTCHGNAVTKIAGWSQKKSAKNKLLLVSIDLSQIEAITY